MPPLSRLAARRDHLVVCGDDALAARVIEELTTTYGEEVTVLLRSRELGQGPRIARLPKVRIIERAELDADAFTAAQVQSARSLALLRQDDLGNFHAALRAQEINPDLRLVVAIFNTSLGERIRTFFRDCAVLSGSSMSAPSFVAAALSEPAPSHIRVAGRTLYVARRSDVHARRIVCGLAMTQDPVAPGLLPPDAANADLVLAVADGAPRDPRQAGPAPDARGRRPGQATAVEQARVRLRRFVRLPGRRVRAARHRGRPFPGQCRLPDRPGRRGRRGQLATLFGAGLDAVRVDANDFEPGKTGPPQSFASALPSGQVSPVILQGHM